MNRFAAIALVIVLMLAAPSAAEPLFAVVTGEPGAYSSFLQVGNGAQFDVVALLDSDGHQTQAVEFYLEDLIVNRRGVFKLNTDLIGIPPIDLGDRPVGEYVFSYGMCAEAGAEIELVRITYGIFQGDVPGNTTLSIRGLQEGDSSPSSFDGAPGVIDCDGNLIAGAIGGRPGPCSMSLGQLPDGTLVFNTAPCQVDAEVASVTTLKTRY